MPKATFILPSLRDKFLDECVNGLKKQTEHDFEVFFFDTAKEQRNHDFRDGRFLVINAAGWNQGKCHNYAKRYANSGILLQQHDDDVSFPERLEVTLALMRDADLFSGSYIQINEVGDEVAVSYVQPFDGERHRLGSSQMAFPFAAYRKDTVPDMWEEVTTIADWVLAYDCFLAGLKIRCVKIPLGKMRVWGTPHRLRPQFVMEETEKVRNRYNDPEIRSKRDLNFLTTKIKDWPMDWPGFGLK